MINLDKFVQGFEPALPTINNVDVRDLEIKISRSENLPVLPQIVNQVLKMADDPNASPTSMEKIIERDPGITAKILRVANSAYYGGNQAPSVGRAISVLGLNTIKSLVIGVAYQQIISTKATCLRFSKLQFWQHSLAVAVGARILGKLKNPVKAEELYAAGMMHDVGLLVLDRFCPAELSRAIALAEEEGMLLHDAEKQILGFDHADVGELLADRWQLPPLMMSVIKHHLRPDKEDPNYSLVIYINAANVLANKCGYRNNAPSVAEDIDAAVQEFLDLPDKQYEVIQSVMIQEIEKAEQAFQIK
jgi:HD-like signal output (HDOD) protein